MSTDEAVLSQLYAHIARDLSHRFDGVVGFESVVRLVEEVRTGIEATSRIRSFVPVLTERVAHDCLRDTARTPPPRLDLRSVTRPGSVLFVCSRSGGRVQLAASLARSMVGRRFRVLTAGTVPGSAMSAEVLRVLREIGIPDTESPAALTDDLIGAADVVVTLGDDACAIRPGVHYRDWDVLDPAGQDLATVHAIRDHLHTRIASLVVDLGF